MSRLHHRRPALIAAAILAATQGFLIREVGVAAAWLSLAIAVAAIGGAAIVMSAADGAIERHARRVALAMTSGLSVSGGVALVLLIDQLIDDSRLSGTRLLADGTVLWLSNIAVFSLWYFELDSGGPRARAEGRTPRPELLFPQQATPDVADPAWKPGYLDYLFVSFSTATAFSPTDTMPLSSRSKMLMLVQSTVSLILGALVIARAVNVLQ